MTVLDTFLILFESDASDAKKDVDSLYKSLTDVEETSKGTATASDQVSSSFLGMGKSALGAIAGVVALGSVVSKLFSQAASIDELQKFSQTVGENVGDVDAWGRAVERAGGSAEGFQQSLRTLNEQMVDASVKGQNEITPFFNQLGISIVDTNGKVRSTIDLLPELAGAFEGLSKQESTGIAKRLGLDQGTILLLQSGRRETELSIKRQKELGTVTAALAGKSEAFRIAQKDSSTALQILGNKILGVALPALTAFLNKMQEFSAWISANGVFVTTFLATLGTVITIFVLPAVGSLAVAMWALAAPIILTTGLILLAAAALGLLADDFRVAEEGGDSFLGKWPKLVKGIRGFIEDIKQSFRIFGENAKILFNAPSNIINKLMELIKRLVAFVKESFGDLMNIITAPLRFLDTIGDKVKDIFTSDKDIFTSDDETEVPTEKEAKSSSGFLAGIFSSDDDETEVPTEKEAKSSLGFLSGIFGSDDEDIQNIINIKKTIQLADSAAIGAQTGDSILNSSRVSNRNTSVRTGDIVINTQATDTETIASEAAGSLSRQLRNTVYNLDDGIVL